MYHQFKQLADLDITKEPMEVGPTTHYIMGGVQGRRDTQMSTVPGLFAAGECAAGINGANRLGGNSLSDISCSASAPASTPRSTRRRRRPARSTRAQVDEAAREALEPFERGASGEGPYQVQYALQDMMQDLVGIVRNEPEMQRALDGLERAARTGRPRGRRRPPRVQPRLARRARSAQPADRVGSDHALRARAQGEPRRPLPRRLSRTRVAQFATFNFVVRKGADGEHGSLAARRFREMPDELKQIIEEMK